MNGDKLTRYTAVAAVLAVAGVAAWISYRHAVQVVTAHGEPGTVGHWYPVVIDGLIVAASMFSRGPLAVARRGAGVPNRELSQHISRVWRLLSSLLTRPARADLQQMQHPVRRRREVDQRSTSANRNDVLIAMIATPGESMVLLDAARHREDAPRLAWWLLAAGIGATLAANVLAGVPSGWLGAVVAAWPALAFVGCYELLMMLVRAAARRAPQDAGPDAEPQASALPSAVPADTEAAAEASMRATLAAGNPWSANALATKFALPRKTATEIRTRVLAEANGHPSEDPAPTEVM